MSFFSLSLSLSLSLLPFGWKKILFLLLFGGFFFGLWMKSSMIQGQCAVANNTHWVDRYQNLSFSLSLSLLFYFHLVHKVDDGYAPTIIHSRSQEWWLLCDLYITHPNRWEKNSIAQDNNNNNTTKIPNCDTQICCAPQYIYICAIYFIYIIYIL